MDTDMEGPPIIIIPGVGMIMTGITRTINFPVAQAPAERDGVHNRSFLDDK